MPCPLGVDAIGSEYSKQLSLAKSVMDLDNGE